MSTLLLDESFRRDFILRAVDRAMLSHGQFNRVKSITSKDVQRTLRKELESQYGVDVLHVYGIDDFPPLPAQEWIPATRQLFLDVPK